MNSKNKSKRIRGVCISCEHLLWKWGQGKRKRKYYCNKHKYWMTFSRYSHYNRCMIEEKDGCPFDKEEL